MHRLTQLNSTNKKHQQKIKDHMKSLLKPNHTIWDESIPEFRPTLRQKQQLEKISDSGRKNHALSQMEREFLAPREAELVLKANLRKVLHEIQKEEEKQTTRSDTQADEYLLSVFKQADARQKVRLDAQKHAQRRVNNELQINELTIQLVECQKTLLNCINSLQPHLTLFLGIQSLERVAQMAESLESYPILAESPMIEETLDSMQSNLLHSLSEQASILGKRKERAECLESTPKQAKNEEKDETSESGEIISKFLLNQ